MLKNRIFLYYNLVVVIIQGGVRLKKVFSFVLALLILFSSVPVHAAGNTENFPSLYSDYIYLAEKSTEKVLFQSNSTTQVATGYLSKIVTGMLVLESVTDFEEVVTVTQSDISGTESDTSAFLKNGEEMTVADLLYCLLVRGGCDAANVLARHVSGDVDSFVAKMNEYATSLGCENTVFKNPSGIDAPGQHTTAYDMYLIARAASDSDAYMSYADIAFKRIAPTNKTPDDRYFISNNYMLVTSTSVDKKYRDAYYYSKAHGIMSSETDDSGNSVVTLFRSGETECICVVLNAPRDPDTNFRGSYLDAKALGTWVFSSYRINTIATAKTVICEAPVSRSSKADYVVLTLAQDVTALFPTGTTVKDFETVTTLKENIKAPVKKGQVLGRIEYYYAGELYAASDLVAQNDLDSNTVLIVIDKMMTVISNPITWASVIAIVVIAIVIFAGKIRRRRRANMYRDANRFRK